MNNSEFYEAITLLEKEKGIKKEYVLEKIKAAITAAVKKEKNLDMQPENIDAEFDKAQLTLGEDQWTAVTNATVNASVKGLTY